MATTFSGIRNFTCYSVPLKDTVTVTLHGLITSIRNEEFATDNENILLQVVYRTSKTIYKLTFARYSLNLL